MNFEAAIMVEERVKEIIELMEVLENDTTVPRNIRKAVTAAKETLGKEQEDLIVRASTAVYALDAVSEDINMPMHARTQIWVILSALERLKK